MGKVYFAIEEYWERMYNLGEGTGCCLGQDIEEGDGEQKNGRKMLAFRIFCELLAKIGLESHVNRGFLEGRVEMEEARRRALTHLL